MSIEAYASATSVLPGQSIDFMVSYDHASNSSDFTIDLVRIGAAPVPIGPQLHGNADLYPVPPDFNSNGCQWPVACSFVIPSDWTSGLYRAQVTGGSGDTTPVFFVVKAAGSGAGSSILLALTVTTYQAYNAWGGTSLYSSPRSITVTFDRPGDWLGHMNEFGETAFIAWAENNGIGLEYCTSIDLHATPEILNYYQLLLSVGHDEYWSKEMRDGVESFIANGGNVAFFSGNTCWWQVRFENNSRSMVCYKSDEDPTTPDPLIQTDPARATVKWYDTPVNRPENHMTGVSFRHGGGWWGAPDIPSRRYRGYTVANAAHWVFDATGLTNGQVFGAAPNGDTAIIGNETDAAVIAAGSNPPVVTGEDGTPRTFLVLAMADLSDWPGSVPPPPGVSQDDWNKSGAAGAATMGIYRNNGGSVFTAATDWWPRGLQGSVVSQITSNVLTRLRAQGVVTGQVFSGGAGNIYAIAANGDLYWYKDWAQDGNASWANQGAGQRIGNGWNFRHVFSGGGGIIYAIDLNGNLFWYKDLAQDGNINWANHGTGQMIGNGWNFRQVFGGDAGAIYAIAANGDLYWYKDWARDGNANWANQGSGQRIGNGWNFRQVLSGGGGVIYAIANNGDLYWYKDLAQNGTANWANAGTGQMIGNGWNFRQVFSGGDGILYAIALNGDLYWYKDLAQDGTANWANAGTGRRIGNGWDF
jgi:hypothetical protein